MVANFERLQLDVFSLNWLGDNPKSSRSAGMMSITYNSKIDYEAMVYVITELFSEYPFFCCSLEKEDSNYYFKIPKSVTEKEIMHRIHLSTTTQDKLFDKLAMNSINLFEDDLYQIHILDHETSFDIVIYGAHLIGDGLTSATALSIILYNYYLVIHNREYDQIFPSMKYRQLLEYAFKMKHTRFGILWWPRWLRFIPGYLSYRRSSNFKVSEQVFDTPVPLDTQLKRIEFTFPEEFTKSLLILKKEGGINSNHLILSLISFSYLQSFDYDRTIATYPINIRNNYGFEAGNLLTANRLEIKNHDDFIDHLRYKRRLLEREKLNSGPYYAISLGKFVKNDYEEMRKKMSTVITSSNLRFSNVGRLPAPNLKLIDEEIFHRIPLSNYYANALPLGSIGVHFFITSLENEDLNEYYLTILHSEATSNGVQKVLDHIKKTIRELYNLVHQRESVISMIKSRQ